MCEASVFSTAQEGPAQAAPQALPQAPKITSHVIARANFSIYKETRFYTAQAAAPQEAAQTNPLQAV